MKVMKADKKISCLIGVGSSICGGSAIAATAPVIDADDEEVVEASFDNATYEREGDKVGRNDPCPCGSGKKYKHCHGKLN